MGGGGSLGSNKTQTPNHLTKAKGGVWKSAGTRGSAGPERILGTPPG